MLMISIIVSTWGSSSGSVRGNEVLPNRKSWVQILGYPSPVAGCVMDMKIGESYQSLQKKQKMISIIVLQNSET